MAKRVVKMPSIDQFRNTIRNVQHQAQYVGYNKETDETIMNRDAVLPVITATGTEKIHGTNAAVCYSNPDGFWVQSKDNIIPIPEGEPNAGMDNMGCAFTAEHIDHVWLNIINLLADENDVNLDENIITVYYEWCGGNIQKNSALTGFQKKAFIFQHFKISPIEQILDVNGKQVNAIWKETFYTHGKDKVWVDAVDHSIFNVNKFPKWDIVIDFNAPGEAQNKMIDIVVNDIEPNSPIGSKLGKEGNVGEGMVVAFTYQDVLHRFKVKGDKHSASKVKTLKPVDTVLEQKKVDFANEVCTAGRLEQAWQSIFGLNDEIMRPTVKATGDFLRAVIKDVWKEESDIAFERGLEPKAVNSLISKVARIWFMGELDKLAGL